MLLEDYSQDYQGYKDSAGQGQDAPEFRADVEISGRPLAPEPALSLPGEFTPWSSRCWRWT